MKYPLFVLPNTDNKTDTQIRDLNGELFSATEFSKSIGGITSLRLMVTDQHVSPGQSHPQITSQELPSGESLFCLAYPSGMDTNNRVTTSALILRDEDVSKLSTDPKAIELAKAIGLDRTALDKVSREISSHKWQKLLTVKKKS